MAPGKPDSAREAGAWARSHTRAGDVLFPYSPAFLAALPEASRATALPYGQSRLLLRTLKRVHWPVGGVLVAVPLVGGEVGSRSLATRSETYSSHDWFLVRVEGPFAGERALLTAAVGGAAARSTAARSAAISISTRTSSATGACCARPSTSLPPSYTSAPNGRRTSQAGSAGPGRARLRRGPPAPQGRADPGRDLRRRQRSRRDLRARADAAQGADGRGRPARDSRRRSSRAQTATPRARRS